MDLFAVPTICFIQLYVLVIVRLDRRELVWINVTRHPTAEWIAQQITEAFPWNEAPRYLIRDRDAIFGAHLGIIKSRPVLGGLHHQFTESEFSAHTGTQCRLRLLKNRATSPVARARSEHLH